LNESYLQKYLNSQDTTEKRLLLLYSASNSNEPIRLSWDISNWINDGWELFVSDLYGGSIFSEVNISTLERSFTPSDLNNILADGITLILKYNPKTSTNIENPLHIQTALSQNFPNPFNPSTTISFRLAQSSLVRLQIFNLQGTLITTLIDEIRSEGSHRVNFNAMNLPTGAYIYRLETNHQNLYKTMMLIK
jgi:hypothetical protein